MCYTNKLALPCLALPLCHCALFYTHFSLTVMAGFTENDLDVCKSALASYHDVVVHVSHVSHVVDVHADFSAVAGQAAGSHPVPRVSCLRKLKICAVWLAVITQREGT